MGKRKKKKKRRHTTTATVRLTDEEYEVLRRLCALKKTSRTGHLARLATSQARKELLNAQKTVKK